MGGTIQSKCSACYHCRGQYSDQLLLLSSPGPAPLKKRQWHIVGRKPSTLYSIFPRTSFRPVSEVEAVIYCDDLRESQDIFFSQLADVLRPETIEINIPSPNGGGPIA